MDLSALRKQISTLTAKRAGMEKELLQFRHKIVKGSLYTRYTACQKGNCKCTKGKLHGPFLFMSDKVKGKTVYRYVGKKKDIKLVKALRRYKVFQEKIREIQDLNKELIGLWYQFRNELLEKGEEK